MSRGDAARWETRHARRAFISAFTEEGIEFPYWVDSVVIHEPPHNEDRHIATVYFAEGPAQIKVLPRKKAVRNFWQAYPNADVIAVAIQEHLTAEDIRQLVFDEIEDACE